MSWINLIQRMHGVASGRTSNHVAKIGDTYRKVRPVLELISSLKDFIPSKEDGAARSGLKVLGGAIKVLDYVSPGTSAFDAFVTRRDLVRVTDEFVSLMAKSWEEAGDIIKFKKIELGPNESIAEIDFNGAGSLFINLQDRSETYLSGLPIFSTRGFSKDTITDAIWSTHGGRLLAEFTGTWYDHKLKLSKMPERKFELYGAASGRLENMIARHRRFYTDKISRSYLFCGEPGTGKSSAAIKFAEAVGDRILFIDMGGLEMSKPSTLASLSESLEPSFIIIDDIDRTNSKSTTSSLLMMLDLVRYDGGPTLILTANHIESMDKAFVRPGRVDDIIMFKAPDKNDAGVIIRKFVSEHKIHVNGSLDSVIDACDGLSHAYLREVSLRLKYETVDEVLMGVSEMRAAMSAAGVEVKPK